MARMKILSAAEQERFNKPPVLNSFQRKQFFEVTTGLLDIAYTLRKPILQIGFLSTRYIIYCFQYLWTLNLGQLC